MSTALSIVGLNNIAASIVGTDTPPLYLVIDTRYGNLQFNTSPGGTSVVTDNKVDQAGDSQIVVGLGLATQETVTWSTVTDGATHAYTLSTPLVNAHTALEKVIRVPLSTDTIANIGSEAQYDATNAPGQRAQVPSGYSPGPGQMIAAFYLTAAQAQVYITCVGISTSPTVGGGDLHAYWIVAYDHTAGTRDVEIDALLTLT